MSGLRNLGLSIIILFLGILVSFEVVHSLGVSELIPVDLKLLRGDSARFYFRIFALDSSSAQKCSYSISGIDPLVVSFDKDITNVNAGEIKDVYGTISVPMDAPIKSYEGRLRVICEPATGVEGTSGSVVKFSFGSGFVVSVVPKAEERAVWEFPHPKPKYQLTPFGIFVIVILIAIVALLGIFLARKKKIL